MGSNNTNVTVGNTTTQIVAASERRRSLKIVNDSNEEVYLANGASAVMNTGIRINASGGVYEHDPVMDGLPTGAWNGICASGGKNVTVYELLC